MNPVPAQTKWWLGTILFPAICVPLGIFMALSAPHNSSDLTAAIPIAIFGVTIFGGCILSVICAVTSIVKKEPKAPVAILAAIPVVILLGLFAYGYIWSKQQDVIDRKLLEENIRKNKQAQETSK
jgi:FtsH-binding integral membrane protein